MKIRAYVWSWRPFILRKGKVAEQMTDQALLMFHRDDYPYCWSLWPWHILVSPSDRIPNLSVSYLSPRHKRRVKVSWTVHFISCRHVLPVQQEISFLQKNWWLAVYYERSTIHHIPNTRMHFWLYPSMHWAGGVCIPTCTGQGVYPSMHWAGEVSAWGVSARGCLTGMCVADTPPGPGADTPLWTDRHLWKHNLHKLRLRVVIMPILPILYWHALRTESWMKERRVFKNTKSQPSG